MVRLPGARFSKVPKTFRGQKAILKSANPHYSVKLVFRYVLRGTENKITTKFRASEGLSFEDTNIIMSP